jgi:hypothetical protein
MTTTTFTARPISTQPFKQSRKRKPPSPALEENQPENEMLNIPTLIPM